MKRNGGTYVAKNEGLSKAKGEYVTFHDSDDWLHPNKIELQVNLLENREDIVACSTKYLRIDENSQILFHSKGAIRHACISLMIRADKVVGKIGFFDGVRVSADAEYEQRIRTTFGDDAIEEIPIPLLLASVRSESLSQGGKFALEWNGITGARLEYRASFENWHQNLSQENNEQYIPHPITKRKFPAPKEMIW
jgi:glycosyltransferase involved in cell wall biosynthesis